MCTKNTDWQLIQCIINEKIRLDIRIKEKYELEEVVYYLTTLIQVAVWRAASKQKHTMLETHNIPLHIKKLVAEKRRGHRKWQRTRNPSDKTQLNRLNHKLKKAIIEAENKTFSIYINNMSPKDPSL